MKQAFLIVGYGTPRDIVADQNYGCYLRTAFNAIFDACAKTGDWRPTIIFSGGKTDMLPPYARTEAGEMKRFFATLCARESVRAQTKAWKLVMEPKAISTLENCLIAKRLLARSGSRPALTIFCEQTRRPRLQRIAKDVFGKARVRAIDFDQSANRYLDPAFMRQKEAKGLAFDLWALKSAQNLKAHHDLFQRRLAFLREAGQDTHVEAVKAWWETELAKLQPASMAKRYQNKKK